MQNKRNLVILWIVSVILVVVVSNLKTIERESGGSFFVSGASWMAISFAVGFLFSLKKQGEEQTKNAFYLASIFNVLMIVGSLYNLLSK